MAPVNNVHGARLFQNGKFLRGKPYLINIHDDWLNYVSCLRLGEAATTLVRSAAISSATASASSCFCCPVTPVRETAYTNPRQAWAIFFNRRSGLVGAARKIVSRLCSAITRR